MSEPTVKKRAWVKNAAIIFLSVLLVLTFFSNTIMNRSLPEVAVEYAESGTITAKIRGSGTVTANETYDVVVNQTREVASALVSVGDIVNVGDPLFLLGDSESDELKTAQAALDELNLAYRKAVINASDSDYAQENYDIQQAEAALAEAISERDKNTATEAEVNQAKAEVDELKARVNDYKRELESMSEGSVTQAQITAAERKIDDKEREIATAESNLESALTRYGTEWDRLETDAQAALGSSYTNAQLRGKMAQLAYEYDGGAEGGVYMTAYTAITGYQDDLDALEIELEYLEDDLDDLEDAYDDSSDYNNLSEKLTKAENDLAEAEDTYEELSEKRTAWTTANANVKSAQSKLDGLVFALAEQQKADGKTQAIEQLDLDKMRNDIAKAQQEVAELTADTVDTTITAAVAGVVTTVNVTAGNSTVPDQPLAQIEVPDRGYSLSFSVTPEQAKKVKVGDSAEVSNYYWGPAIKATLSGIKNDPDKPGQGKLLYFALTGEVESGSTLTLAVGEKSANYDKIVPNSALRSDSNGDFVLIVIAKSTPLGNRYIATRADVQVLASDDTHTAVASAAMTGWDYVITTSSAPVEPGMQVRLVED